MSRPEVWYKKMNKSTCLTIVLSRTLSWPWNILVELEQGNVYAQDSSPFRRDVAEAKRQFYVI